MTPKVQGGFGEITRENAVHGINEEGRNHYGNLGHGYVVRTFDPGMHPAPGNARGRGTVYIIHLISRGEKIQK